MKKFLSLILALAISMSLCVPAFAANKKGDKETIRVVESCYENSKLVTTYEDDQITMDRYSTITENLILSVQWKKGTDYITIIQGESKNVLPITLPASSSSNNVARSPYMRNETLAGYSYRVTYGARTSWTLSCPRYNGTSGTFSFACTEMDSFSDKLDDFRADVDNIAAIEEKIKIRLGAEALSTGLGMAFAAADSALGFTAALTGFFTVEQYGVEIYDLISDMDVYIRDAYDKYWRVQREWSDLARIPSEQM